MAQKAEANPIASVARADFANLIGSQALLAKQLDLRWRWELRSDPASSSRRDNDAETQTYDEENGVSSSFPEQRLFRKKHHSMPFLVRNLSSCPFQPLPRSTKTSHHRIRRVRTTSKLERGKGSSTADILTQCFGIGSPNKSKRKRQTDDAKSDSSPTLIRSIRQKITGWFSHSHGTTPTDPSKTDNGQHEVTSSTADDVKSNIHDVSLLSRPFTAHELFLQSPLVRRMVLDQIDPSLHHDEEFIRHRIQGLWREITSDDFIFKTGGSCDYGHNDDMNSDGSSAKDIMTFAYWVNMEEKARKKCQMEKQRKVSYQSKSGSSDSRGINMDAATWNRPIRNQRNLPPIYFHYLYINHDNHPATVVEETRDRKCPFCIYYGKSNEDLLSHCGIFHGVLTDYYPWAELRHGLSFQAVLDEDKNVHVVVRSTENITAHTAHDFTFLRSHYSCPDDEITHPHSIPFLRRSHPHTAAMDPLVRRRRLLALEANDAPVSVISSYLPTDEVPLRQYFHSKTNLPMENWDDVDSDDESDDEWLHKRSADLMEEFEDVSAKEKKFMQLWNRFIFRHVVIADRDIPGKCHEFIQRYRMELKRDGMRDNLLLHLMNLWDSGVISSVRILACMQVYDEGTNKQHVDT
eukprot:CCRYP_020887-RA/>CCRYP_020887-RA protein AED:0.10 eAED:0.10 QI:0/-1/0/1/-1/1/1/0/632